MVEKMQLHLVITESSIPLAETLRPILRILVVELCSTELGEEGRSEFVLLHCLDCAVMLGVDHHALRDLTKGLRLWAARLVRSRCQHLNSEAYRGS